MRPCRGLTKDGKEVKGWPVIISGKHYIMRQDAEWSKVFNGLTLDWYVAEGYFIEVIPETVGQSTGLKDKNGKDLDWWEGDIFARSSDVRIEGIVIKDLGCFWLDRIRGGRTLLYECVDWSMYKVGNIHQKPELIEDKDNEEHST